ncbi:Cathepsin B-like cysteine proteinase [Schistosoma japonicum]|nr:Cathepsin B-like cysteine proteinase [Schistosoma japonicum]
MLKIAVYIVSLFTLLEAHVTTRNNERIEPLSDEMISFINEHPDAGWKAEKSDRFHSLHEARILMGARKEDAEMKRKRRPTVDHHNLNVEIPSQFDSRKKWPHCKSIAQIRDQSRCGSCWAFGAVEAMTDRICIQSGGGQSAELSALDLISCCKDCGDGCQGGFPGVAWDYWVKRGIVTGGSKENHTGCQPYPFPKCEHHTKGKYPACGTKIYKTPQCKQTCQKGYKTPYEQDKHYVIQRDIMMYGPVEAAFDVYEDFLNYKSGIYRHVTGSIVGGHAIRIIGWGVEKRKPYWLIANSWNEDWGDSGRNANESDRFHSLDDANILLCARKQFSKLRLKRRPTVDHDLKVKIPSQFDSRKNWPHCESISQISDQSKCASISAVSAVGAISDRICIQSGGKQSVVLSAIDFISCCENCDSSCDFGFLGLSWEYWVMHGIVTGGSKENHTGCQPYSFPKSDYCVQGKYPTSGKELFDKLQCKQTYQKRYKTSYKHNKHYGGSSSYNVMINESGIEKEIMMYRPVKVYLIYEDYLNNKSSGIYKHITGLLVSGHYVCLIEWGFENGNVILVVCKYME